MSSPTLVYFDAQGRGESIRLAFAAAQSKYTDRRIAYDKWDKDEIAGLSGKDANEQLLIDEIIDTCQDLLGEWVTSLSNGPDDLKAINNFKDNQLPKYFNMLEKLVQTNGSNGFACGKRLTIADAMLFNTIEQAGEDTLSKYPCLKKNKETVSVQPGIAEWIKARPQKKY
ncbi:hypothetical protein ACF0H5_015165 [Mactra antiquata]